MLHQLLVCLQGQVKLVQQGWMITATKAMAIELSTQSKSNAIAPVAGLTPLLKSFMGGTL